MSNDLIGIMITVVLVAAMGLTSTAVLHGLDESTTGLEFDREQIAELDGLNWVQLNDGRGSNQTVKDSRGLALQFDGTDDAYVSADSSLDVAGDDTWTVSQPVLHVRDNTQRQTFLTIGDPNLYLQYLPNGTGTDVWSAVYLTTTDSYRVNVSAPNATSSTPSFVFVTLNGSTLTIYRNGTSGESVTVTNANHIAGDLTTASNFNGSLDETRTFDSVLNSSQRQTLRDDPVGALPGTSRTARLMYDEGSWVEDRTVYIFWSTADATRGPNTTYVDGFEGHVLNESSALDLKSDDYKWRKEGPELKPVADGRLDGAPVAYVDYRFEGAASRIRQAWQETMGLVDVALIAFMATVLFGALVTLRQQR